MIKPHIHNPQSGAVALMMVILLTSLIAVVGVSLAVMNLDYTLGVTSSLFGKNLTTAADGCLDSALAELTNNNAVSSLNVNNIGAQNANCVVTIRNSGNYRFLTARATTTSAFLNSVAVASSTVNVATNPYTVVSGSIESTAPKVAETFATNNNLNVGSSSGLYATVSVDGGFAYVSYRDGANGNKLTITKVNLSTFAVTTSLTNVSSVAAIYEDSVIHRGYLYVSYRAYTGVNGTSEKLSIARVDLNNFTSNGTTVMEDLSNACATAACISYPDAIAAAGDYIYIAFRDQGNSDKIGLKRLSVTTFTTAAATTLNSLSSGTATNPDMVIYNGYAYVGFQDNGANAPMLKKVNLTDFSTITSLNMDSGLSCTYVAIAAVDNNIYFAWDEYNNGRNASVARVSINSFTKGTTLRSTVYGNYLDMDTANGYLFLSRNYSSNTDVGMLKIDLRSFTVVGSLLPLTSGDLYERPHVDAPGGSYVYEAFHDRGAGKPVLFRIKVD
jgi:hypothetical protein